MQMFILQITATWTIGKYRMANFIRNRWKVATLRTLVLIVHLFAIQYLKINRQNKDIKKIILNSSAT